jgi:hypothetical protein
LAAASTWRLPPLGRCLHGTRLPLASNSAPHHLKSWPRSHIIIGILGREQQTHSNSLCTKLPSLGRCLRGTRLLLLSATSSSEFLAKNNTHSNSLCTKLPPDGRCLHLAATIQLHISTRLQLLLATTQGHTLEATSSQFLAENNEATSSQFLAENNTTPCSNILVCTKLAASTWPLP